MIMIMITNKSTLQHDESFFYPLSGKLIKTTYPYSADILPWRRFKHFMSVRIGICILHFLVLNNQRS